MWVVRVQWRGRGPWQDIEECLTIGLALGLAEEYRRDGHHARLWFKRPPSPPRDNFSAQASRH